MEQRLLKAVSPLPSKATVKGQHAGPLLRSEKVNELRSKILVVLEMGYTETDIARESGVVAQTLSNLVHGRQGASWLLRARLLPTLTKFSGQPPFAQLRRAIQQARRAGYTDKEIAAAAKVSDGTINLIRRGRGGATPGMERRLLTALATLKQQPARLRPHGVFITPSERLTLVQTLTGALHAGHTQVEIEEEAHIGSGQVTRIFHQEARQVSRWMQQRLLQAVATLTATGARAPRTKVPPASPTSHTGLEERQMFDSVAAFRSAYAGPFTIQDEAVVERALRAGARRVFVAPEVEPPQGHLVVTVYTSNPAWAKPLDAALGRQRVGEAIFFGVPYPADGRVRTPGLVLRDATASLPVPPSPAVPILTLRRLDELAALTPAAWYALATTPTFVGLEEVPVIAVLPVSHAQTGRRGVALFV